ncbi:MAG TPA: zf-TFIIB domain-containing protein [bacterium]|mgnify:CR=1 FL=1|nr:zf-TFIIB domain-containing protein [bacterium]
MCPHCHEPLVVLELEGVEIDYCLACGGIWLDTGELELIAERAGAEPGGLSKALASAAPEGKTERTCPRCGKILQTVQVGDVELDRCRRGHGLWLDRGELQTLVSNFASEEEGAVALFLSELLQQEIQTNREGA